MTNEDRMLRLVLSDHNLSSNYDYDSQEYQTIDDALRANNPIVVAVAKIIKGVGRSSDKSVHKEVFNEVYNFLNNNLL